MKYLRFWKGLFITVLFIVIIFQGFGYFFKLPNEKRNSNIITSLKVSNSFTTNWSRTWGGIDYEYGYGVEVDSSGNVYLVGTTFSFGEGGSDMVLVKYNNKGEKQWNVTWGGIYDDQGGGIAIDNSQNLYIVGSTNSSGEGGFDIVLVKYNIFGVEIWNRTWGGIKKDRGYEVAIDSSGNILVAGNTISFGEGWEDLVIIKYNNAGIQIWNNTWGGASNYDYGEGVDVDSFDNVYLVGTTFSFGQGSGDMVLVKYDSFGVQLWNQTWGDVYFDYCSGVAVDTSDNVYLVGGTDKFEYMNMILVKFNSTGILKWNRSYGGSWPSHAIGRAIEVNSSDSVLISGYSSFSFDEEEDMVLVNYNSLGEQLWDCTWGGSNFDAGLGITLGSPRDVYVVGITESFGAGEFDIALVKFNPGTNRGTNGKIAGFHIFLFIIMMGILTILYLKKRKNIFHFS